METRRQWKDTVLEIVLYVLAIPVIYPFFLLVISTFKEDSKLYSPLSFPKTLFMGNYSALFDKVNLLSAFMNSTLISFATLALLIFVSSMAGYIISRNSGKFTRYLLMLFLAGMVIPLQANMVPIYKLALFLHILNTRTLMVLLYTSGAIPFAILIYQGFTKSIPRELEEAAKMDGCGLPRMFGSIIFPLLLPATGTIIATTISWYWNDFQGPLIYMNNPDKQTLISQIYRFYGQNHLVNMGPIFALCTVASLPILIFFLFTQKYMIRGLVGGALKG